MALGGIAELLFGVRAEQQSLEHIARPLTMEELDRGGSAEEPGGALAERVRARNARHHEHDRAGLRRFRPGPGTSFYSPGMVGTAGSTSRHSAASELELERELAALGVALARHGPTDRDDLERELAARYWGPGRFRVALREAVGDGQVTHPSRDVYAAAGADDEPQR
jgi:hypothetical protein